MNSDFKDPINIGSDEMVSINELPRITIDVKRKKLNIKIIPGPLGVKVRISDNQLNKEKLNW